MVRSQLYIFTIFVILFITISIMNSLSIFEKELQRFRYYYPDLFESLIINNFLNNFRYFLLLDGSSIYPIYIYFYCNNTNVSIPNIFNTYNIIVLDKKFFYLPTFVDKNYINVSLSNYEYINQNLCYFYGYIAINSLFNSSFTNNIIFQQPKYFYIDNLSSFYVDKILLFEELNGILKYKAIGIQIDPVCTYVSLSTPTFSYSYPTINIKALSIINQTVSGNIVNLVIKNNANCPFYFDQNSLYYIVNNTTLVKAIFGYNFNFSSDIIYPNNIAYVQIYSNTPVCIFQYGERIC